MSAIDLGQLLSKFERGGAFGGKEPVRERSQLEPGVSLFILHAGTRTCRGGTPVSPRGR